MGSPLTLRSVYLFSHLSDERLAEIEAVLERRHLEEDEVLFNLGDPGDEMYIVVSGRVAIYAPDADNPGNEKPIRVFEPEGALGEMALIDHKPRSLSARALEPSDILVFGYDDFRHFVNEDSDLSFAVMQGLSDRIRYTTQFLNEVRTWVSRVTQGEYSDNSQFISEVRGWVKQLSEGDIEGVIEEVVKHQDETLSALAAEFAQMAAKVKEREEELKQEIVQLQIEIDQSKRKQEVDQITQSDYFLSLKDKIQGIRQQTEEE